MVQTITVIANLPVSAAFETASFGGLAAGDSVKLEVLVSDALGNQNTDANEVLGVTALSSDVGVVTVRADLVPSSSVNAIVTVFGQVSGVANITGTVTTSQGVFPFGPAAATVLTPIIGSITPSSGPFASLVTIAGNSFLAPGFETLVLLDGKALGNITVVSDNQINAQMGTYGTSGAHTLEVTVGGVPSNTDTWTQVGGFDPANSEPANEVPATAPSISLPASFSGIFSGIIAVNDFFIFTLSADATVEITISWSPAKDLDLCLDTPVTADVACVGDLLFIDPSGTTESIDLTAGDYVIQVNDFDAVANGIPDATTYVLSVEVI